MSDAPIPKGPVILWVFNGSDGWSFIDCETITVAIGAASAYGAQKWYLSKPLHWAAVEIDPIAEGVGDV